MWAESVSTGMFTKKRLPIHSILLTGLLCSVFSACEPVPLEEVTRPIVGVATDYEVFFQQKMNSDDSVIEGWLVGGECRVTISSDIDGRVWSGWSDEDGNWVYRGNLSEGSHTIRVEARCGNIRIVFEIEVDVRGNEAPSCRIASPLDGQVYDAGSAVAFIADVEDPNGDALTVLWRSSLDGGLIEGSEWAMRMYTPGSHQIDLSVFDEYGAPCSDTINIEVR